MSASLVGSEMCIRDRFAGSCGILQETVNTFTAYTPSVIQRATFGTSAPVSYTHLTLPTICSV
eukprot:10707593-Alexandrium_andersonii.AAC.1